ncbi:MAG: hypothetical protein ACKV19_02375 [Verrucomicrobiales bacterium]
MKTRLIIPFRLFALWAFSLGLGAAAEVRADDHGHTVATATRISSGVTRGTMHGATDIDCFAFSTRIGGTVSIAVLPPNSGQAPVNFKVELLDAVTGRILRGRVGNDLDYLLPAGSRGVVRLRGVASSGTFNATYRLKLAMPDHAMPFPATSNIVHGSLESTNDIALYSFQMPAPGLVNLVARPASASTAPINVVVELFDSAGRRLDIGLGSDIRRVLQQAGSYTVRVRSGLNRPNVGRFALQVLNQSRAVPLVTTYAGSFDVAKDRDYLRISVPTNRRVRLTSSGTPGIFGQLYDAGGNRIAQANSGRTGLLIDRTLVRGTYYLLLEPSISSVKTGAYRIVLSR